MAVSRFLPYPERAVTTFAIKPPCACEGAPGVYPSLAIQSTGSLGGLPREACRIIEMLGRISHIISRCWAN